MLIYLYAPVYCSFSAVHRFESEFESVLRTLPKVASPEEAVIIGFDSHFLGYRHAGYYLPAYFTLQYPEVRLISGIRVFGMKNRDTSLFEELPLAQYKRFVFLPLPSGDQEYRDFLLKVKGRFPSGALQTAVVGGREFTTGPISRLPILFPVTIREGVPVNTGRRKSEQ
ncbi:MAG TPA: hypothetical protein DEQ47_18630 [Solibacterales bacterium]|nr:hypothetical protein [Bryobacterales bacterium]